MPTPDIQLYLDEDVWMGLATALRNQGHDVIHATEIGRQGLSDSQQLAFAVSEGRALLSHNTKDFVPLASLYFFEQRAHSGIILAPHLPKGELIRLTQNLLRKMQAAAIADTVQFLADYR